MSDLCLIGEQRASVQDGRQVTTIEFLLPNHAIVMAINATAIDKYPFPAVYFDSQCIPLRTIAVHPDGRILEGRPPPQFEGCHSPIVYEGRRQRQGEEYSLSFHSITRVDIATRPGVDHKPVIDEMVAVMEEAYTLKDLPFLLYR